MAVPRDVTPIVSKLRNWLLGYKYKNHLRYESRMSARTQPPPCLPEGVAHKVADNYYTDRDGRREVTPPEEVYLGTEKLLDSGKKSTVMDKRPVTPGFPFNWNTGRPSNR